MNLDDLMEMTSNDAALRRRQALQPVGGKGDKIFPPTYPPEDSAGRNAPPRHVYERRRVDDEEKWCVLVDSVQSQANRLEESLLEAIRDGLNVPYVVVDFSKTGLEGIDEITSLDAPHRVYDAILRDSLLDGQPFMSSETGRRLTKAKLQDASALLETSPNALLFGAWHSTGEGGGLGAKFARSLTSEIVAIDVPVRLREDRKSSSSYTLEDGTAVVPVTAALRPKSRIDPLGILSKVNIYLSEDEETWTPYVEEAKKKKGEPVLYTKKSGSGKAGKAAVINHGNVKPDLDPLGITCDYLEHTFVLSFAALRRLRFGSSEKNEAGRALLAALGLVALTEQDTRGYALRSRCDLVCDGRAPLEQVRSDGSTNNVTIDVSEARELYGQAHDAAKRAGFELPNEPLRLQPQDKLVEIVRQSQKLALELAGGEDDEGAGES